MSHKVLKYGHLTYHWAHVHIISSNKSVTYLEVLWFSKKCSSPLFIRYMHGEESLLSCRILSDVNIRLLQRLAPHTGSSARIRVCAVRATHQNCLVWKTNLLILNPSLICLLFKGGNESHSSVERDNSWTVVRALMFFLVVITLSTWAGCWDVTLGR